MYIAYQIWSNFIVFFVALTLTPGIVIRNGLIGFFVCGIVYSVIFLMIPKAIEFLKLNVNFWSYLLVGTVLSIIYFYLMRYIFVGFMVFSEFPANRELLNLKFLIGYHFSETGVILFASVFTTLLSTTNKWLMEK